MTGFLRFFGMLNAAVWLGATAFFTLAVTPAAGSRDLFEVLGEKYFGYLSGAIIQIILTRYFYWHIVCALIAWLHLLAEWLYLGRTARRFWLALLGGLLAAGLVGGIWLGPKLRELHRGAHALNLRVEDRAAAMKRFEFWHGVFQGLNLFLLGGVAVYFWHATHPPDEVRFVGSSQFRG